MQDANRRPVDRIFVERIVREVLAEIADRGHPPGGPPSQGELIVACKVVSLRELEGRLEGVTRLVVPRGAVITPSARDELRGRQIAIASAIDKRSV